MAVSVCLSSHATYRLHTTFTINPVIIISHFKEGWRPVQNLECGLIFCEFKECFILHLDLLKCTTIFMSEDTKIKQNIVLWNVLKLCTLVRLVRAVLK